MWLYAPASLMSAGVIYERTSSDFLKLSLDSIKIIELSRKNGIQNSVLCLFDTAEILYLISDSRQNSRSIRFFSTRRRS